MSDRRLILGTAGHIDHGKTALVHALTGVDTDRLKEEKARGITIDLGFAELSPSDDVRFGVVDVPGHEAFVRNMLAGATGMDMVLLVVAADEGVMPQTREHVDIVRLLGVERMVVALTKADLVDEEWLELAAEDVRDLLSRTPFAEAPIVPTSARDGTGLDTLREALVAAGEAGERRRVEDLARLPIDRVFTVKGTGTVVTGTLWSGRLDDGCAVRLMPDDLEGRVRGVQVHGSESKTAEAGQRTAVAITGSDVRKEDVTRGFTLVTSDAWSPTSMLTVRLEVLPGTAWEIRRGQRVRVHIGTSEVMARVALLDGETLIAGEGGWAQLRLEKPVLARGRDRLVVRSYSPVETIGGGVVVEPSPPKRKRLEDGVDQLFEAIRSGDDVAALGAALALEGWEGAGPERLQVLSGLDPERCRRAASTLVAGGVRHWVDRYVDRELADEARERFLGAIDTFHADHPLRDGIPLEQLRQLLDGVDLRLVDALIAELVHDGLVASADGVASRAGYEVSLSAAQEKTSAELLAVYRAAGLQPPAVSELPEALRDHPDIWPLLKRLERAGTLVALGDDVFVDGSALEAARQAVETRLGGRDGLGPADFREALPVSRKHLMPLLAYFDRSGVTVRSGDSRHVPAG